MLERMLWKFFNESLIMAEKQLKNISNQCLKKCIEIRGVCHISEKDDVEEHAISENLR